MNHPGCLLLSYDTKKLDMGKSTNFSGQPIFNQLLTFIDKSEIRKIAKKHGSEHYVKKFTTYNHLVVRTDKVVYQMESNSLEFLDHLNEPI